MAINWALAQQGVNPLGQLVGGYQAGATVGKQMAINNALSQFKTDPTAAISAVSVIDPEKGNALREVYHQQQLDQAKADAAPLIQQGKYGAAAAYFATVDPKMATTFLDLDKAHLDQIERVGQHGASVLFSAASFTDPTKRLEFVNAHREDIIGAGIPADQFDSFDWSNTEAIRAEGLKWLGAKELAGNVKIEKWDDEAVTVQEGPTGAKIIGRETLPETRAHKLDRAKFAEQRRHNQVEESQSAARIANGEGVDTVGKVIAPIFGKIAKGIPLAPGEQQALDQYSMSKMDPMEAQAIANMKAKQKGASGKPAAPAGRPAQPRDPYPGIKEGQFVVQGGVRYQRRGSQMVPVK